MSRKQTTTKLVQATEKKPFTLPDVSHDPERDDDPWGTDCLTHKQRLFVRFYVNEAAGQGTRAAQLAGYKDSNRDSLKNTASDLLSNPRVARAVEAELAKRFGSPDDIVRSICAIAQGNAADYLKRGPDGELHIDMEKMAENGALGLIEQFEEEVIECKGDVKTVKRKMKLYSKMEALRVLARINGQIKPIEIKGTIKHTHEIKPAMARLMGNPEAYAAAKQLSERITAPNDN